MPKSTGPIVLSIETSCDETAAAVLDGGRLLSSCIYSQTLIHRQFGGVVPEVASRNHLSKVEPLVSEALEKANVKVQQIDCVAALHEKNAADQYGDGREPNPERDGEIVAHS